MHKSVHSVIQNTSRLGNPPGLLRGKSSPPVPRVLTSVEPQQPTSPEADRKVRDGPTLEVVYTGDLSLGSAGLMRCRKSP